MLFRSATLINGGVMYKPRLVAYIDNIREGTRQTFEPEAIHHASLKPEHVEFIKRAMQGVNKEGTGRWAFAGAPYTSGGKTGTAQVIAMKQNEKYDEAKVAERLRDHSWFISFAPVENPKIAMAVIVENGGFGARAAAPITRTVLDYFLLGKLPAAMQKATPVDDRADQDESD